MQCTSDCNVGCNVQVEQHNALLEENEQVSKHTILVYIHTLTGILEGAGPLMAFYSLIPRPPSFLFFSLHSVNARKRKTDVLQKKKMGEAWEQG